MESYPSYKDSGVEWIGEIPSHWDSKRLKHISNFQSGYSFKSEDFSIDEEIPVVRIGDVGDKIDFSKCVKLSKTFLDEHKDFIIKKNDIMVGMTGGTIGKSGKYIYDEPSLLNQRVCLLRNQSSILNGLLYHYVKSEIFKRYIFFYCYGGGQDNIGREDIMNMIIPLSSLETQTQIVSFLDNKTQKIDELIEKTEQKIQLLKEKRTSLINHCVTKGLNPDVEMKDSGVEWIGEIPSHWETSQIKFVTQLFRGKFSHRPRNDQRFYNGEYPFIQTGDIVSSGKYLTNYTQTLNEKGYSVSKEFPLNTLVMTISGNIGDVSILKIKSCFPDSIIGFFPFKNTSVDFLYFVFSSLKNEFYKNSTISTQMNLNIERVGSIKVPLLPKSEQTKIVEYLDEQTQKIDSTIEKETQRTELLKEYRQSLISEVVTGKVDVRNYNG
jgi:type I restriction enzyme, S subunit